MPKPNGGTIAASRFAHLSHLIGLGARDTRRAAEEEDDKKKKPDEEGGEDDKDGDEDEDKKKKPDEESGEDDKDGDEDEDKKKKREEDEGKKGSAAASAAFRAGAKAERARCGAIFAAPEAGHNPALAAHLAFETDLAPEAAIGALRAGGVPARGNGLGDRMQGTKDIRVGADGGKGGADADTPQGVAAGVLAAMNIARGKQS